MAETSANDANAAQAEFWNGQAAARWVLRQDRLDRMLNPFGEAALSEARPQPGETVLDVGCGCGATALAIADRLKGSGSIQGVDISAPMLGRATERAAALAEPKPDIRFQHADAQVVPLGSDRFDLAFSRFGVMFFADPVAAFRNIHTALKPGGRIAFACWRGLDENPWLQMPLDIAFQHVPPPPPPSPEDPGPFSLGDPARVKRILAAAGFNDVTLTPFDYPITLGEVPDLEGAIEFLFETGPLGTVLADAAPPVHEAVRAALRTAFAPYHGPQGVRMNGASWVVRAKA